MRCFPLPYQNYCRNTERDNTGLRYSNPNKNNAVTWSALVVGEWTWRMVFQLASRASIGAWARNCQEKRKKERKKSVRLNKNTMAKCAPSGRRGGVVPMTAYTARLRPREVPFSGQGYERVGDFTSWIIWKGREICPMGLWMGPKELIDEFHGFINSR